MMPRGGGGTAGVIMGSVAKVKGRCCKELSSVDIEKGSAFAICAASTE